MEAAGSSPTGDPRCGLCLAERAPYTCPRCQLRFCSVPCYRGHGSCARDFQRRELQLRLQGQRGDEVSRRRLREALLRLRELREPGDADPQLGLGPLSEQAELEGLWEQLSPEQRKAFQRALSSGAISALLPPWRPWWVGGSRGAALIQELGPADAQAPQEASGGSAQPPPRPPAREQDDDDDDAPRSPPRPAGGASPPAPAVPAAIPPLASLAPGSPPPSPLAGFQLPNVLYAYAYALSLYNGDAGGAEAEFCETVLDVSGALGAKQVFRSTAEALQAALQAVAAGRYPECPLRSGGVMLAAARLLAGGERREGRFALAALAHLSRLLRSGKRRVPAGERRAKVFAAQKKCEFLLSWANENEEAVARLALEAHTECRAHLRVAGEVAAAARELQEARGAGARGAPSEKALIEELD